MGKTALPSPSAGSSGNPHRQKPGPKPKHSQQQSSSAPSSSTLPEPKLPLPQCKVKRNYACAKCPYYTQNPRSFLHHQKNVHAERLKVYECSHCLYASKHSQKLQRHVHMVHQTDSKANKKHHGFDEFGKPLLVPPVRIRVQRFEKFTDQHVAKLVIVEDVDVEEVHSVSAEEEGDEEAEAEMEVEAEAEAKTEAEAEAEAEVEEEEEEEEDELDDEEAGEEEELEDEYEEDEQGDDDDGSVDADDRVPVVSLPQTESPTSLSLPPPQQLQQKKYKLDKPSVTFIRCSVCPFGSHSRTLVNRHEKSAHLKKKFFRCMKCNYVTHMRARYTKHVKYHTMPMIKCDDCDFRTPYKWNLDRHNRNHSIIAPGTYKCSHCSFSADIKQSLTVHETNHHVPPVGGVFPANGSNRRRYRVGASDAPGSAVDGTEIVTYETTKEDGVVEFMTETKSTAPSVSSSSGGGSASKAVASKNGGTCTVVKKTTTTTTTSSLSPMPIKVISVTSPPEGSTKAPEQKQPARRRPMPMLIPIVEQSRRLPTIVRMRLPVTTPPAPSENSTVITADDYYSLAAGQSALSDFASIIDDTDCAPSPFSCGPAFANATASGVATADRRRSSSSTGSSSTITSPKSKTASFFDKLKAKVDETADLTCSVCRYESKCLSEFMRHQRTHGDDEDGDAATAAVDVNGLKTEDHTATTQERTPSSTPPPPPPPVAPVTAAELKSTRCQRCRKRCKTSTELILHLATCRGTTAATTTAAAAIESPSLPAAVKETITDEDQDMQQHPMENKIFVWNTSAVATPPGEDHVAEDDDEDDDREEQDSVTVTEIVMPPDVEPPSVEDESEDDINDTPENTSFCSAEMLKHQEQLKHAIRKEGKMYKTVFKCPHCTFWAATASRFHVHIVGHLNRKPFECSCCAYRSNWRWDITKHIRLKSAKRGGSEETAASYNSHQGAKVLMTDETGRRNYSKYNRYLTVMEMDISDGADKAAGGECEDGKGVRKSVGGGITRKRRAPAFAHNNGAALLLKQHQTSSSPGKAATMAGQLKRFKAAAIRNQQLNQQQNQNNSAETTLLPPSSSGGDGRSKTVWKCKKCFFRDCDRLTVLNHVKAHYRRGEFGSNSGATKMNSSQHGDASATTAIDATNATINELYIQTKKSSGIKEKAEQNSPTTDRRKIKIPTTGTTSDKLLLLSTNPKSLMLYDDENFLSCPLCDVTAASPGQLKEHMQCTHIPEETKYRCEYCPFWSEEKKAMLDHMMFAHEMDDGSVNTDVNATDVNYGTEQRDESASNSFNDDDDEGMQGIDENGSSDDVTANMTMFDNGSDDTNTTTNMEVMFDTTDENIVVIEAVECKPDFVDNDGGSTVETPSTPSKSSEKSSYSSNAADDKIANNMVSCEYDGGEERDEDEEIIVRAEEVTKPTSVKIIKEILAPTASTVSEGDATTVSRTEIEVFECNECWYYSTNRRDLLAHKQLHVERGALYNCTECVFNVTKAAILYHHYRHGHVIEEPELRYPEDSVVRAGQRDMIAKNADDKLENKTTTVTDVEETNAGPPMVWHYRKENVPPFTKVFKCRYCPHTNRRRHNTVEHERMHSDHPDHQNHRQMQQRLSGCSVPPSPLHPCKRCTYVCNNAGVLASHVKVHSTSYSCSTVGFYDVTVVDTIQIRALEYVMELEQSLLLDKITVINSGISHSNEMLSDTSSDNESQEDVTKYTEIDEPELKFCPYCPARYFFITDLRFHIRFHRFRGWKNACDCCSFVARDKSHVDAHEIVHCDEYAERTTELIASGYPVNPKYPQPSEYPVSVSGGSPPQLQSLPWSPPELPNYNDSKTPEPEPDSQRQRRTKRMRYSEPNVPTAMEPPPIEYADDTSKRRRRSIVVGVAMKTPSVKPPPPALLPVLKTTTSKSTPPPLLPAPQIPVANAINTTSVATIELDAQESTSDAPVKPVKNTKASYIRQFMCTMCPGKFFKSTALQYHKTLHSGPGRYRCRRCDYAVSTYGNLVRHETVHRDLPAREKVKTKTSKKLRALSKLKAKGKKIPLPVILSEMPATSDSQPENATDNNDGQEEIQIDPEFGSAMLGNPNFYYATTVKNGVVRTKRYKCPKCPSAFDKRDQFAVHLTLHGARDKYQCDKCDYAVRYTANYVQHQRKHAQDAEIRKNIEQAAGRAKMIKEQEEASNAPRIRRRPTAEDRKPQRQNKLMLPPPLKLQPQDTTFTNEISDQQTAYELNAAYGATGNLVGETTTSLFRCAQCPFECDIRSQLDRHTTHHYVAMNSSGAASKRSWKRSCRFCTYRTHGEVDLAEHTRVHFLRSTGEPVPNNGDYSSLETYVPPSDIGESKHIEFHGKRVVYSQRRRNNTDDQEDVPDDLDEGDIEPFFVFKDCGEFRYPTNDPAIANSMTTAAMIRSHKRFSPDRPPPHMTIDYNDNRTGDGPKAPPAAFVRFFDSGTRLEFLDDDPAEPAAGAAKRRRSKK